MARGDYVEALIRTSTGNGIEKFRVTATADGREVETDVPQRANDLFAEIREVTRGGTIVRKFVFNKGDLIGLIQGHEDLKRPRKAKS